MSSFNETLFIKNIRRTPQNRQWRRGGCPKTTSYFSLITLSLTVDELIHMNTCKHTDTHTNNNNNRLSATTYCPPATAPSSHLMKNSINQSGRVLNTTSSPKQSKSSSTTKNPPTSTAPPPLKF